MNTQEEAELVERKIFVKTQIQIAEDFSDGAFWGFMQEHGIEADEVVAASSTSEEDDDE